MIRKERNKFILYNKSGDKKLGTHDSYDKALKQERAIKANMKADINPNMKMPNIKPSLKQKLASDINQAAVDKLLNAGLQESEGSSTGVDLHMPIIPMPEISRPPLIFEDKGFARPEQQSQSIDKNTLKALGLAVGAGGIGLAKLLRAYLKRGKLASDVTAMAKIKL